MPSPSPPIGIRSIEITDFRRIDHLRLDFGGVGEGPSDIAVIGGPNGCGKTSVLEACLIGLGFPQQFRGETGPNDVLTGRSEWTITTKVQTPHGLYRHVINSRGHSEWFSLSTNKPSQRVRVPCLYFSSWRAPKLVGALPITAGRRGKRPSDSEPNRIWRAKQHLIDSLAHRLMYQQTLSAREDTFEDDRRRLNDVWATFYPRVDETFVAEPVSADPSDGFDVFLHSKDGRKVPVDALSSGQLELFALFGALMLARFTDGILVIDEPELHLDPQWHALMVRAIRRFLPSAQLLIATHSPKVFDSVMSFQRHLLVPDNDPRAHAWKSPPEGVAVV